VMNLDMNIGLGGEQKGLYKKYVDAVARAIYTGIK